MHDADRAPFVATAALLPCPSVAVEGGKGSGTAAEGSATVEVQVGAEAAEAAAGTDGGVGGARALVDTCAAGC